MLVVKKFGGSSVADKERIFNVARRCIEDYEKGNDVVVVLSAMGKTTDGLIAKAHEINPNPPKRELDMLLVTGEQVSVALMAMAMSSLGVPAVSLNAAQVVMHTSSAYGSAKLKRIDVERIRHESTNMMILPLWEEAAQIPQPWLWLLLFMQMCAKSTRMWKVFIPQIRELYRTPESWQRFPTMKCWNLPPLELKCFTTAR